MINLPSPLTILIVLNEIASAPSKLFWYSYNILNNFNRILKMLTCLFQSVLSVVGPCGPAAAPNSPVAGPSGPAAAPNSPVAGPSGPAAAPTRHSCIFDRSQKFHLYLARSMSFLNNKSYLTSY